ncbi:hypothetical protein EG834_11210, partial [bacterium]|nr:hypothetical protein [bacterium]
MGKKVFTIEYLLYAAVFVLAILLRFVHLGQMPLNNFEAEQALQALKFSTGGNALMGDQPAYVILTAALFKLFSSGNFAARFWPALVGSFAVFLPFLFRRILGQRITFLISLFLAIDPALIAISRTAGAQSLAIVFGVAAVGFLVHKKVIPAGIFLSIAIASGPAFWLGSLILLLVYLISHLFLRLSFFGPLERKELVLFGVCLLFSTALLSTGFLTVPNGITGVSNGLVAFIRGWGIHSLVTVPTAVIVLAATYLPVVIIGAFGYFVSRAKRPELAGFFGVWFAAGIFVVLFNPSREIIDWVWVVVPLWGLSALGIETLLQRLAEESRMVLFVQISLTVALLVFSILNMMAFFFNPSQDAVQQNNRLIAAALPLGLLLLLTVFLAWGWSPRSAFRGLGLGIGFLL